MKLLRLYLVLVFVLLLVLLCIIVSLSLFARIIQVSLDSPPWPGTVSVSSSSSSSAQTTDGDSHQRPPSAQGTGSDKASRETEDKANRGTEDKVNRKTEDKANRCQENLIRQLEEKDEEIRFLVGQRDRLRKDVIRLQTQIDLLSIDIRERTENNPQYNNNDDFDDDFLNASPKHRVVIGNSSTAQERLPSDDVKWKKTGKPLGVEGDGNWITGEGGVRLTSEHEVIPYTRFTLTKLYLFESGLEPRVIEKPMGHRKRAIDTVIEYSLARLNEKRTSRNSRYGREDFLEGIFRSVPGTGEQYELYFADKELPRYNHLSIVRVLAPPIVVSRSTVQIRKNFIYTVVPLSGRIDKFRKFMERFVQVAIVGDNKIYLMVVYFGQEGLAEVKDILRKTSSDYHYPHMNVLTLDGEFSRGKALREGVRRCPFTGDVLMFFCDVDIVITTDFLERCRLNTEKGRRVYYPIVFSLYNPRLVSSLQARSLLETPANDTLVLSTDNGFWRDFGYGMTCQYRSDFDRLNGFSETIHGWGLEDVLLYRKYLRSDLVVVRATDPGIIHLWHEKTCDTTLSGDQYRGCIRSKALNEASHVQLGMLALGADIDLHRNLTSKRRT